MTSISDVSFVEPTTQQPQPNRVSPHPLDVLYGVLFTPALLMEALGAAANNRQGIETYLQVAVAMVVFVAIEIPVAMQIGHSVSPFASGLFASVGALVLALVQWLGVSLILSSAGYVFTERWRMAPLLAAMGLAMAPWLLLAPVRLLSVGMPEFLQPLVRLAFMAGLTLWALLLTYRGIAAVFRMSTQQAFVLFLLPTMLTLLAVFWLADFFQSLGRLFI